MKLEQVFGGRLFISREELETLQQAGIQLSNLQQITIQLPNGKTLIYYTPNDINVENVIRSLLETATLPTEQTLRKRTLLDIAKMALALNDLSIIDTKIQTTLVLPIVRACDYRQTLMLYLANPETKKRKQHFITARLVKYFLQDLVEPHYDKRGLVVGYSLDLYTITMPNGIILTTEQGQEKVRTYFRSNRIIIQKSQLAKHADKIQGRVILAPKTLHIVLLYKDKT